MLRFAVTALVLGACAPPAAPIASAGAATPQPSAATSSGSPVVDPGSTGLAVTPEPLDPPLTAAELPSAPLVSTPRATARDAECRRALTRVAAPAGCDRRESFLNLLVVALFDVEAHYDEAIERERQRLDERYDELVRLRESGNAGRGEVERRWAAARKPFAEALVARRERLAWERDDRLAPLESCAGTPRGLVRALRAELLPECTEQFAAPMLRAPADIEPDTLAFLRGQLVAYRLEGMEVGPFTAIRGSPTEPRLEAFVERVVEPWQTGIVARLEAFEPDVISLPTTSNGGWRAREALARAWWRFVHAHRAAPIPSSWKRDATARSAYYGTIERSARPHLETAIRQQLEANQVAEHRGIVSLPAASDDDRATLALSFGRCGIRPPHQDLLLPLLPEPDAQAAPRARLARRLPAFFSERLADDAELSRVDVLEALVARGLPVGVRRHFRGSAPSPRQSLLLAHARVRLGLRYVSAPQFAWALQHLAKCPATPEANLLHAVALALLDTPATAAGWLALDAPPDLDLTSLEQLTREADDPATRGLALFDLGHLRQSEAQPGDSSGGSLATILQGIALLRGTENEIRIGDLDPFFVPGTLLNYEHERSEPPVHRDWHWLGR